MNEDVKFFRIGLFVAISAGLLAFALVLFGAGKIFQPSLYFETYVDSSVQGIDVGSPVKFRGVTIGKVSKISFVFNEYPEQQSRGTLNYVIVLMEVTKPVFPKMFEEDDLETVVQDTVKEGLRARIEPQGITGMNYMELDYISPKLFPALEVPWKPENLYIPSAPGQITSLLDSINKIMRDIEHLNMGDIGNQILSLTTNLNKAVEQAQIGKISSSFQEFAKDASLLVRDIHEIVKQVHIEELSSDARKSFTGITSAVNDLKRILHNIEPASQLNSDDINATLANFRTISQNLRLLTGELRANPSRLIFGSPPPKSSVMEEESMAPTPPKKSSRR